MALTSKGAAEGIAENAVKNVAEFAEGASIRYSHTSSSE